ncbi:bifunctional methylenetetrahydrofolate dehydrogenase/methenyltetrahydrofolate cyclohydrolase FolD [Candidatus Marinamargulisbacteria bacterium SCGC AG-414-C22]|nr:bifunctional methylenetetrahydrofolate dehydrogenase/methenyltetrahydrofolate cyclohydrolase FolD [Candidatus Marinamargulisbacteria bacterium SCGC AG-414-C22]
MKVLDGVILKKKILSELKEEIATLKVQHDSAPGLAVIIVGENPASQAYVGMKKKACENIGIISSEYALPEAVTEIELINLIKTLNNDSTVDGILLQLPLPDHLNSDKMLELISPSKDVDGFHPMSVGRLLTGLPTFKSCTPYGVCELMKFYDIDPAGKHVVILGRSNIVGKPLAAMLIQKDHPGNATVTVCHSRSENMTELASSADILIAAIGKPLFVKPAMVKDGAVVIDVGINRVKDSESPKGFKLVGDVDYDAVSAKTSAITPVPGGVGPLTIAMLMKNTVASFKQKNGIA